MAGELGIRRGKTEKGMMQTDKGGGRKNGRIKVGAGLRSVSAGKAMEGRMSLAAAVDS